MGLFSKKCDICFRMKSGVKKNRKGWNVCGDCRNLALNRMSNDELQDANIQEISYAARNGSLSKTIELIETKHYSIIEALDELKPDKEDVNLMLKNDEVCYYYGSARSYHEKNIITAYKSSSSGVSVGVVRGFSIRSGSSITIPIRSNISETYEGDLYITNKRIILLTKKYGFDLGIDTINAIEPFKNGFRVFYKDKCYTVITYDNSTIFYILELINRFLEGAGDKKITSKESLETNYEEIYEKAKSLVIDLQKASASLIQIKLKIDYDTALEIINRLEKEGIVGPANGSNPREVYVQKN